MALSSPLRQLPVACCLLPVACCLFLWLCPSPAHAQPTRELRIAIHAPWSGPATADERHALAQRIDAAVESAGLGPVTVSSYARLADFRRALGQVDLAIVDAHVAAGLPARFKISASWTSGAPWVIAASARPGRLAGLRLALQAGDDPASLRMVFRLLRGQAGPGTFVRTISAPVTDDARQLVLRGVADVVVLPARQVGSLTTVAELGSFGELALAVDPGRPQLAAAGAAAQEAVRAALGGSWTAGVPALPRTAGPSAPLPAAPLAAAPDPAELLAPAPIVAPPLALADLWMEPDAR